MFLAPYPSVLATADIPTIMAEDPAKMKRLVNEGIEGSFLYWHFSNELFQMELSFSSKKKKQKMRKFTLHECLIVVNLWPTHPSKR